LGPTYAVPVTDDRKSPTTSSLMKFSTIASASNSTSFETS
jgi:hypothetical protein